MVQNLLTCWSNSPKPVCPDIRPVYVWVGAGMQLNSGRACRNPKIETRFIAGLLQMIHQKDTMLVIQTLHLFTFKTTFTANQKVINEKSNVIFANLDSHSE